MPNCREHPECDLVCPLCKRGYYCHSATHAAQWYHRKRDAETTVYRHRDIDTIDEAHDMGEKWLTDPFTKE